MSARELRGFGQKTTRTSLRVCARPGGRGELSPKRKFRPCANEIMRSYRICPSHRASGRTCHPRQSRAKRCHCSHPKAGVAGISDIAIRADQRQAGTPCRMLLDNVGELVAERLGGLNCCGIQIVACEHQESTFDAAAAAKRIVEISLSVAFDDRAAAIVNPELGQPADERALHGRQARYQREESV